MNRLTTTFIAALLPILSIVLIAQGLGANHPPIAIAGHDQTVGISGDEGIDGASVTLSGAASSDPDGDPLTYAWADATGHFVGCTACHVGPNFSDEKLHNTGVAWREPSPSSGQAGRFQDEGRFAVTGKLEDHGAFKTPTLREIARTAPRREAGPGCASQISLRNDP